MAARKKMLIAQSDLQRQTLLAEAAEAQEAVAQFKKRFAIVGLSSVAMNAGLTAAKMFFSPNGSVEAITGVGGLVSKIVSGISLFRQLKSLFTGVKKNENEQESG